MLTEINKIFRAEEDWIVIDLSPERDLLQSFAANLSNYPSLSEVFREAKINLSFLGLGVEIEGVSPITDLNVAVTRMLEKIKKKHKRVLVNIGMIAEKYKSIFELTDEEATEMAKETRGYPFAFQVLGYLCFKHNTGWHNVLPEFSQYLEEYVYEKIWSELSKGDKELLVAMAKTNDTKVEAIRKTIKKASNSFSVYRNRLIKKGLIISPEYGHLEFTLPRFKEFVLCR